MIVYTSTKNANNKTYVGYTLFGENNAEYATNVFSMSKSEPMSARLYGVMSAAIWVRNNKPLYCDRNELQLKFEDRDKELLDYVRSNENIKSMVKKITPMLITSDDIPILYSLERSINFKVQKDMYDTLSAINGGKNGKE